MKYFILKIGGKHYFCKINNFLIIDNINIKNGNIIIFKRSLMIFNNYKIYNVDINALILKHFFLKNIIVKKKRRKNYLKKIINYKKKTLLFIQNYT